MRHLKLVVLTLVAACSSAGSPPPTGGVQQQSVTIGSSATGSSTYTLTHETDANVRDLVGPVERVWAALPAAFDSIGIVVTGVDPATHTMGNKSFKAHGRLKGTPWSRFLDCGESSQIGSNADNFDIVVTFTAQARTGNAGHTWLTVSVDAVGRPPTFAQDYSRCTSKGELERRFTAVVERAVAK